MNNLVALKVTYNDKIQQTQYIHTWYKTILDCLVLEDEMENVFQLQMIYSKQLATLFSINTLFDLCHFCLPIIMSILKVLKMNKIHPKWRLVMT